MEDAGDGQQFLDQPLEGQDLPQDAESEPHVFVEGEEGDVEEEEAQDPTRMYDLDAVQTCAAAGAGAPLLLAYTSGQYFACHPVRLSASSCSLLVAVPPQWSGGASLPRAPNGEPSRGEVGSLSPSGRLSKTKVPALLVVWDADLLASLEVFYAEALPDCPFIGFGTRKAAWCDAGSLVALADSLGYAPEADEWETAAEGQSVGAPSTPSRGVRRNVPGPSTEDRLGKLEDNFTLLLQEMQKLTRGQSQPPPGSASRPPGRPTGPSSTVRGTVPLSSVAGNAGLDASQLETARSILKRPGAPDLSRSFSGGPGGPGVGRGKPAPKTKGVPSAPRRAPPEGTDPDFEELDVDAATGFAALIRELRSEVRGESARRPEPARRPFGLDENTLDDDGGSPEDLGGAKGILGAERLAESMRANPSAFADSFETRLARALDETESSSSLGIPPSHHLYRYLEHRYPVGQQRSLGYMLMVLSAVHRALIKKEYDRARFLSLAGVAAAEQYLLDGNWRTGWSVTGLQEPPWERWRSVDLAEAKKATHSRLLDPRWVAVLAKKIQEEELLLKRRGKGGGKTGKQETAAQEG